MQAKSPPAKHYAGPVVGVVLALVIVALSLMAITATGYGMIAVAVFALWFGVPLLALLAGTSLYYLLRKPASGKVYAWMWLPSVAAACIVPVFLAIDGAHQDAFNERYPAHREVHINLTGLTMQPDVADQGSSGGDVMAGGPVASVMRLSRYPTYGAKYELLVRPEQEGYAWLYGGEGLSSGATSIARRYLGDSGDAQTPVQRFPLSVTSTVPDLKDLQPLIGNSVSAIEYRFFHYPDHTEVGGAISLAASQSMELEKRPGVLVHVGPFNAGAQPIARVQINGQELSLGDSQVLLQDPYCRAGGAYVRLPVHGRWQLRWHAAQAPFAWHSTEVELPEFPSGENAAGRLASERVDLHFLPGAKVLVQRLQERRLANDQLAVRATPLSQQVPCHSATEGFDPSVVRILPP